MTDTDREAVNENCGLTSEDVEVVAELMDRKKINERIAKALGWKKLGPCDSRVTLHDDGPATKLLWADPDDVGCESPPDFFTDPVAATALWEWLFARGFDTLISPEKGIPEATCWEAEVTREGLVPMVPGVMGTGPTWMAALADAMKARVFEAADKAIQEAARG